MSEIEKILQVKKVKTLSKKIEKDDIIINTLLEKLERSQHIRNIENWKLENIEPLTFHETDTYILNQLCDPLKCWSEQKTPITKEEVLLCLEKGEEELVDTPLWNQIDMNSEDAILENREKHIKKIAYFVKMNLKNLFP